MLHTETNPSPKSIKALHDEYLKVLHGEKDNVLEAASKVFLGPLSMASVQSVYESYQARQFPPYNFLEAMSRMILDCRKQRGWDRDLLPTNESFPVGTTWDELRVPFFVQFVRGLSSLVRDRSSVLKSGEP